MKQQGALYGTDRPRYEFKYLIDAQTAEKMREAINDVMVPDPHAVDGGYQVQSLYYDSSELDSYFEKLDGVDDRYKIRIRWYGELPDVNDDDALEKTTVFLESKHRINQLLSKTRVKSNALMLRTALDMPVLRLQPMDWVGPEQGEKAALLDHRIRRVPLQPMTVVSYYRQAFITRIDPTLRVTFDWRCRVQGTSAPFRLKPEDGDDFLPPGLAVMEIKFHWAMPLWLLEVCRSLGLNQRRYSKYCSALERMHPNLAWRGPRFQDQINLRPFSS